MLLIFKCSDGHVSKKLSDINTLENIRCYCCDLQAVRTLDQSQLESNQFDKLDNGYMAKAVEFSPKFDQLHQETTHNQSKLIRKRKGLAEE